MAAFDFSSSFSGINSALANLGKQNEARWLREAQADVGRSLQSGDYGSAAQKAFGYGDSATGLGLLKLGEAAKDRAADANLIRGVLGGGAQPMQSLGTIGQPVAAPPVQAGDRSLPRGLRNNNPGNIEDGDFARGLPGYAGSDGRFARFETLDQGVNASERLLDSYGRRGFNTINAIVNRWAPASENGAATNNYIAFVAKKMGVSPDQPLDMANPEVRRALALAKGEFENGRPVPIGQTEPVQLAQAQGGPQADVPAPGAAPTQFVVPPADASQPVSLADNPQIQNLQRAYAAARTDKARDAIKARMDLVVKDLERRAAVNQPTDVQRNYEAARRQGYQGTLFDYQKELRPQTNVNLPVQEKEYDKQAAKDFAEMNRDLIKGAQSANTKIATLNRLETLLTNPNIKTGAGAQIALQAARLGKSVFGIETEGLGPAEAVNAIANQFALELRNPSGGAGMPGALSDKDREFLQQSTPGLERTPEGNKLIIDYMRRLNKRSVEVERLRRDYIKGNKGRLDEGFFDKLAEFSEKNPLFPEAPSAPRGPVTIKSAADYDKLKSGDQFIDPDGNLRTKR